ncbi:uncharacterized protein LOC120251309 [Dioscorea cayenensis subsp. rotundata]|uniref:Uncharacterized protein LOC120251309 n=1 Tax=Dioscorea cayennensis subsp. rotundata TaxID=55577 RepID=A0AB40ALJ1_DIOCR|nr:uncharacterized protein LOC120251309 [Dioscorea cayenensis subsp. rotundata]
MLTYAKFLEELLTNKRKLEDMSSVILNEKCSTLVCKKLPTKEKDPGGFIFPCTIVGLVDEKALVDLGAIARQIQPKTKGIIEDILVRVDKFIFPVDFIVLDIDDMVEVSLILVWPFITTSKAHIDVKDSRITLRVGDEETTFRLRDSMKHTMDFDDTCSFVDVVNKVISYFVQETFMKEELADLLEDTPLDDEKHEG